MYGLLTKFLGDYLKNAKKLKIICTVSSVFAAGLCGFKMLVGWLALDALLVWGLGGNAWRDRPLGLSSWASHDGRSIPKKQKQKQAPLRLPQRQVHHIIWDNKSQRSAQMQMMEKRGLCLFMGRAMKSLWLFLNYHFSVSQELSI